MIRRYFYIFATTFFILLTPTRGIQAREIDLWLEVLEKQENGPPGFNYQGVLRNSAGEVHANKSIVQRISLWSETGNVLAWQELHEVTTNAFGLFEVIVGEGTSTGASATTTFNELDWRSGILSMQVEVDMGNVFLSMGENTLQSVPYSLHADNGLT